MRSWFNLSLKVYFQSSTCVVYRPPHLAANLDFELKQADSAPVSLQLLLSDEVINLPVEVSAIT